MKLIKLFIMIFTILVLLSSFVSATRYVNYQFKEATIDINGIVTYTNTPITNVSAIGYVCTNGDCSTIGNTLWGGAAINSGALDNMQLTYPTTLQNANGYGVYYYTPDYITWESNPNWWGTTETDPQGPYNVYVGKKEGCHAPIDTFTVVNDVQPNVPLVIGIDASLDSTTYAAIRQAGPLDYIPPNLANQYYSVDTRITLEIYDWNDNLVETQVQDTVISFSGSVRVEFTWTPTISGDYRAIAYTDVTDSKCSSSIQQETQKNFHVLSEDPRNMCYTLLNNLDRKSTRLNSSHTDISRMPSSA